MPNSQSDPNSPRIIGVTPRLPLLLRPRWIPAVVVPAHQLHVLVALVPAHADGRGLEAQVPRLASQPGLGHAHRAAVVVSVSGKAAVRLDQLTRDVRHVEADAVVALGGADDGQLLAVGEDELVVDHGLGAGDLELLAADVVLEDLALVAADLELGTKF